jgi:hypothetical protein
MNLSLVERMENFTVKTNGCWKWTGGKTAQGYGNIWFDGSLRRANRIRWQLCFGEIPEGMLVLHKCDNPECTNPDHLFIGTQKDNMQDMIQKGRGRKANGSSHYMSKFTEQDILEMRKLSKEGHDINYISEKFSAKKGTIRAIINRTNWKWLKD